ncbi:hypothetical protein NL676_002274 [Syzygium grande]|nr:hypothetical protein NL676_002274 [Syzygium grande]
MKTQNQQAEAEGEAPRAPRQKGGQWVTSQVHVGWGPLVTRKSTPSIAGRSEPAARSPTPEARGKARTALGPRGEHVSRFPGK